MRTVRPCFAFVSPLLPLVLLPLVLLPTGHAQGQEAAVQESPAQEPAAEAAQSKAGAKKKDAAAGKAKAARPAADRLNLDATKVVGNRELPKVLYIVPWKRADLGELPGQPINSLLDEVLAPLDRDEYRREIRYYQAIAAPADQRTEAAPQSQPQSAPAVSATEK